MLDKQKLEDAFLEYEEKIDKILNTPLSDFTRRGHLLSVEGKLALHQKEIDERLNALKIKLNIAPSENEWKDLAVALAKKHEKCMQIEPKNSIGRPQRWLGHEGIILYFKVQRLIIEGLKTEHKTSVEQALKKISDNDPMFSDLKYTTLKKSYYQDLPKNNWIKLFKSHIEQHIQRSKKAEKREQKSMFDSLIDYIDDLISS